MKKILEGVALGKNYEIYEQTGVIVNMSTRKDTKRTKVVNNYGWSIEDKSEETNFQYIDIVPPNGDQTKITLKDFYVPCRWQDALTFWFIGGKRKFPFAAFNHRSKQLYQDKSGLTSHLAPSFFPFLIPTLIVMGVVYSIFEGKFRDFPLGLYLMPFLGALMFVLLLIPPFWIIGSLRGGRVREHLKEYRNKKFERTAHANNN